MATPGGRRPGYKRSSYGGYGAAREAAKANPSALPVSAWERRVEEGHWCPRCDAQEWGTPDPFGVSVVKECHSCGAFFTLAESKEE
jgi:hypothetical protein